MHPFEILKKVEEYILTIRELDATDVEKERKKTLDLCTKAFELENLLLAEIKEINANKHTWAEKYLASPKITTGSDESY